ncbi:hypothetical protein L6164_014374 [Bauhinia variegata]|uniref:Uncharacterized protein n=1 Tax=Bauhinia variegata TaxID=167791 RepID=A0ACB9NIC4_BAUVA|nr:hypothetical protein L6164_014374 [Bauhinia variegata]
MWSTAIESHVTKPHLRLDNELIRPDICRIHANYVRQTQPTGSTFFQLANEPSPRQVLTSFDRIRIAAGRR